MLTEVSAAWLDQGPVLGLSAARGRAGTQNPSLLIPCLVACPVQLVPT